MLEQLSSGEPAKDVVDENKSKEGKSEEVYYDLTLEVSLEDANHDQWTGYASMATVRNEVQVENESVASKQQVDHVCEGTVQDEV